jgi:hypothetical protein
MGRTSQCNAFSSLAASIAAHAWPILSGSMTICPEITAAQLSAAKNAARMVL